VKENVHEYPPALKEPFVNPPDDPNVRSKIEINLKEREKD